MYDYVQLYDQVITSWCSTCNGKSCMIWTKASHQFCSISSFIGLGSTKFIHTCSIVQSITASQLNPNLSRSHHIIKEPHHIITELWLSLWVPSPHHWCCTWEKTNVWWELDSFDHGAWKSTWDQLSSPHLCPLPPSSPCWTKILGLKWTTLANIFRPVYMFTSRLTGGLIKGQVISFIFIPTEVIITTSAPTPVRW